MLMGPAMNIFVSEGAGKEMSGRSCIFPTISLAVMIEDDKKPFVSFSLYNSKEQGQPGLEVRIFKNWTEPERERGVSLDLKEIGGQRIWLGGGGGLYYF